MNRLTVILTSAVNGVQPGIYLLALALMLGGCANYEGPITRSVPRNDALSAQSYLANNPVNNLTIDQRKAVWRALWGKTLTGESKRVELEEQFFYGSMSYGRDEYTTWLTLQYAIGAEGLRIIYLGQETRYVSSRRFAGREAHSSVKSYGIFKLSPELDEQNLHLNYEQNTSTGTHDAYRTGGGKISITPGEQSVIMSDDFKKLTIFLDITYVSTSRYSSSVQTSKGTITFNMVDIGNGQYGFIASPVNIYVEGCVPPNFVLLKVKY